MTAPTTEPTWHEDPVGIIEDAGDVGGDVQAGPSVSRRFIYGPVIVDGQSRYMVVDEYAYPVTVDVHEDDARHGTYSAGEQTMISVCTDPHDPGGTELYSDVEYGPGDALVHETVEQAGKAARRLVEHIDTGSYGDPTSTIERTHQ